MIPFELPRCRQHDKPLSLVSEDGEDAVLKCSSGCRIEGIGGDGRLFEPFALSFARRSPSPFGSSGADVVIPSAVTPLPSRSGASDYGEEVGGGFKPFDARLLPEPLARFSDEVSRSIGCDASFIALPLLASCTASIGNSRCLVIKAGWSVPAILWTVVVGESGTAKSPSMRVALGSIRRMEERWRNEYKDAMARHEEERVGQDGQAMPAPQKRRLLINDTTFDAIAVLLSENPRGLLLANDELASWLWSFDRQSGGRGGSVASRYLPLYGAEPLTVDRKVGEVRTVTVPAASLSVTGGIQPAILRRLFSPQYRESGLAARFLVAYPPRRARKWTDDEVSESAVADVERVIARLNDLEPQVAGGRNEPRPIRMSGDARKAYREYCERNGTEQLNLSGDLASAWSKLEEAAARLALVVHCVRAVSGDAGECELDEVSMRMGIDLAEWFKAEARRIYAFFNETEDEGETRQLADWVGRRGGRCTPREAQQGCRWLKKRGSAREALDGLVKAGVGEWLPEGVGRARDVFAIRRSPAT